MCLNCWKGNSFILLRPARSPQMLGLYGFGEAKIDRCYHCYNLTLQGYFLVYDERFGCELPICVVCSLTFARVKLIVNYYWCTLETKRAKVDFENGLYVIDKPTYRSYDEMSADSEN